IAFRQGLAETGHVDGQNVTIEYRWGDGKVERLPALAAQLVRRRIAVLAVAGSPAARLAAKNATATIPIVFVSAGDPIEEGLVTSLSRPGGNITGVSFRNTVMDPKRLGLLHEVAPSSAPIAILVDPAIFPGETQAAQMQAAARALGRQVNILNASSEVELDSAFSALAQLRSGALLVTTSPFFNRRRQQLIAFAARNAIPAIYESREFALAGGLMSYGASVTDAFRQLGAYVGKILKGAVPAALPVVQTLRLEFVINVKAAKALGLKIPQSMLLRTDELIE
ncbi:MAG: ABC transporter substrate-binding protein, partial [Casimicrobiaceae bacterium]